MNNTWFAPIRLCPQPPTFGLITSPSNFSSFSALTASNLVWSSDLWPYIVSPANTPIFRPRYCSHTWSQLILGGFYVNGQYHQKYTLGTDYEAFLCSVNALDLVDQVLHTASDVGRGPFLAYEVLALWIRCKPAVLIEWTPRQHL